MGFLYGVLEAFWELLIPDLVSPAPLPPRHFWWSLQSLGTSPLIFSGGFWALLGGGIALAVKEPRRIQRLLLAGTIGLGLETLALALAKALLLPWTPVRAAVIGLCLVAGWYAGGALQRLQAGLQQRYKGFEKKSQAFTRIVFFGLAVGWGAAVIQRMGWIPAAPFKPDPLKKSRNILILVIDSLRSDHLSLYGYPETTTPVIDEFVKEEGASVFRDCQANAVWTRPSVQQMMTGKLFPRTFNPSEILSPEEETLFERFHKIGYQTGWFVANPYAAPEYGVPQQADGFFAPKHALFFENHLAIGHILRRLWDHKYLHYAAIFFRYGASLAAGEKPRPWWVKDDQLRDAFLKWVSREPAGQPWIAYLHLMSAHHPYGDTRGQKLLPFGNEEFSGCELDLPARDRRTLEAHLKAYDWDISYADQRIGEILSALKKREDWGRTVVLLTADHGEEFGEHGSMGHNIAFHRGVTHVPLIVRLPSEKKLQWIDTPVQLTDLFSTVLTLAELPETAPLPWPPALPIYHGASGCIHGLRWGRYQLYASVTKEKTRFALYDLGKDPEEKTNLADRHPEWVKRLKKWGRSYF